MNDPTLKTTAPDGCTSGSGQKARRARLTNKVYQIPLATTIPNFDSQIEHEYWQRRATDCLYRAWVHHRQGNMMAVNEDLKDYFLSNDQQREDTDELNRPF